MHDARVLVDTLRLCHPEHREGSAPPPLIADAWPLADANALVGLAELEGAALWLHRRLKALDITLAGEAQARISALARDALAKSMRMDAETSAAFGILHETGVPFVPLKGAAMRRIAARVPYVDARARADVDILVREADARPAWDAFVARGYAPRTTEHEDGRHLPGLFGATGIGVELHVTTVVEVAPAEAWRRATGDGVVIVFEDQDVMLPSDTELFWHAMSHAIATSVLAARDGLRLRYWLDAAALIASGSDIDWPRVRARIESAELAWPSLARRWVQAAGTLAGRALPPGALGEADVPALDVERLLAWRLHVIARHASNERWYVKLLDEGARGEARLPYGPHVPGDTVTERMRHAVAVRAARTQWRMHRWTE